MKASQSQSLNDPGLGFGGGELEESAIGNRDTKN
jgi:hypothetical protein